MRVLEVGPGLHPVEKWFLDPEVDYTGLDADTHRLVEPQILAMFEHYGVLVVDSPGEVFRIRELNSEYRFGTLGQFALSSDDCRTFDLCFMANVLGDPASWRGHVYADPGFSFVDLTVVLGDVSKVLKLGGELMVVEDSEERFEAGELISAENFLGELGFELTDLARGQSYLETNLDCYPSSKTRYEGVVSGSIVDEELDERYVARFKKVS